MQIWKKLINLLNREGLESMSDYGINVNSCEAKNLHCLKYSIFAPKTDWVTRACRGTVVSQDREGKFNIEAVGFERFYNLGEAEGLQSEFDWDNCVVEEKWDGSLIKLFYHTPSQEWIVSTSGTPTGDSNVDGGYPGTFRDLFWETFDKCSQGFGTSLLNPDFIYVYELCTPFNRIVVDYKGDSFIKLLAMRRKSNLIEIPMDMGYQKFDPQELVKQVETLNGLEHEGWILRDINGNRIKLKCPSYVSLHRIRGNSEPDWFTLWSISELEEFCIYFPEFKEIQDRILNRVNHDCEEALNLVSNFKEGMEFRDFAIKNKEHPQFHFAMAILRNKVSSAQEYIRGMNPKNWKERYVL